METMTARLLVLACACAAVMAEKAPPYLQAYFGIIHAAQILDTNVLSMAGNIPLLNDSRRHYAEIINVIIQEAKFQSGCVHGDYFDEYQRNLNSSAPQGISNPAAVIAEIQDLLGAVKSNTNLIRDLLQFDDYCFVIEPFCDSIVDQKVQSDLEKYGLQAGIFIAAGKAAFDLKVNGEIFETVSNNLAAHQFVITKAAFLEKIILSLSNVYRSLDPC